MMKNSMLMMRNAFSFDTYSIGRVSSSAGERCRRPARLASISVSAKCVPTINDRSQKPSDTVGEIRSGCQGRKAGGAGLGTWHLLEPVKQAVDIHRCGSRDLLQMGLGETPIASVAQVESPDALG